MENWVGFITEYLAVQNIALLWLRIRFYYEEYYKNLSDIILNIEFVQSGNVSFLWVRKKLIESIGYNSMR